MQPKCCNQIDNLLIQVFPYTKTWILNPWSDYHFRICTLNSCLCTRTAGVHYSTPSCHTRPRHITCHIISVLHHVPHQIPHHIPNTLVSTPSHILLHSATQSRILPYCHSLPQSATVCHSLPQSATVCHSLPQSATLRRYAPHAPVVYTASQTICAACGRKGQRVFYTCMFFT